MGQIMMDSAELFLKRYDELYKRKDRKSVLEYPYHSETQLIYRARHEIPESALSNYEKQVLHL